MPWAAPSCGNAIAVIAARDSPWFAYRLARDLPGFLRGRIDAEWARDQVRGQLAKRGPRFLAMVDRQVYDRPGSPYCALLARVGCERGDLRALVAREGVEGALAALARQGVYVALDELKGRRPALRGSSTFHWQDAEFDNPFVRPHFVMLTGGTGGVASTVYRSLDFVSDLAAQLAVVLDAHAVVGADLVMWWTGAFNRMLTVARLGSRTRAWYYPVQPLPWTVRAGAVLLAGLGKVAGRRFPLPRFLDVREPGQAALALHAMLQDGPVLFNTVVSSAVRMALWSTQVGLSLRGATFLVESEPFTHPRSALLEQSGARAIVDYSAVELSGIGYSCAAPLAADDVHVFTDRYAVIQSPADGGGTAPDARPLLFTALGPSAPKIALNVDLGDSAVLAERDCECPLGQLGLQTHLSEIHSHEKLTGEGVTVTRSMIAIVIDRELPSRFGRGPADYQFVEHDSADSGPIEIRVSHRVGQVDADAVVRLVLETLERGDTAMRHQASLLRASGGLRVSRAEPVVSSAGKTLPFVRTHLVRTHLVRTHQAAPHYRRE
ncbi:MAG: hypothetical protein U0821_05340 [Chloroflexota bacterium]